MAMSPFGVSYMEQLRLVVRILPAVARNGTFTLKGGGTTNLFERELPRLSPFRPRAIVILFSNSVRTRTELTLFLNQ